MLSQIIINQALWRTAGSIGCSFILPSPSINLSLWLVRGCEQTKQTRSWKSTSTALINLVKLTPASWVCISCSKLLSGCEEDFGVDQRAVHPRRHCTASGEWKDTWTCFDFRLCSVSALIQALYLFLDVDYNDTTVTVCWWTTPCSRPPKGPA